ncbi:bifunctional adenosylcobinamide kinase/adenosylcobinamide-phosphate guanylyltransferase [Hydrogenoanaerobacterium sp.]|uniref:bifunctional adenosylcobinamide kinase/adenosylcobinamide-phosphate guanylyltransferase n=1 Tax=Hydrogenoanaerobacterium sp. TaxID=2953763 RepID=UPI00289CFBCC|nr:bifunctional adenosylcobinamide kinase/adenosylcobinamide-phosphate guanylyltransferase [Hydrogenoanaerobacterium sp.]
MLTLVTGGSASGKSEYAEGLAIAGGGKRYYIATMQPMGTGDAEFEARVARHREMRAHKGFETIECYTNLSAVVVEPGATVLLECLSNLAANEFYSEAGAGAQAQQAILAGVRHLCRQAEHVIVVSNEVFGDGVCYDESTQQYLQLLGCLNRCLAQHAQRVIEVVYTIQVHHKNEGGEGR